MMNGETRIVGCEGQGAYVEHDDTDSDETAALLPVVGLLVCRPCHRHGAWTSSPQVRKPDSDLTIKCARSF